MSERQKILIVDDRRENLVALQQILRALDVHIVEATSGNEALTLTLEHGFAVIILDVMMPGMSGYEVAEHLRGDEKTQIVPIIFLTAAQADEQHVIQGYEAGGIDYIVKPFEPEILLGKVRLFLEMDRYRRELQQHREHLETLVAERTADLNERVKELKCLHAISRLTTESAASIEATLQAVVELIPSGWQYSEVTCARIVFQGNELVSAGFTETSWCQSADIVVSGQTVGRLDVCYKEEKPEQDEGPFLSEERDLVDDIAGQLGVMIQRESDAEVLRQSEEKFRRFFESQPEYCYMISLDALILDANQSALAALGYRKDELVGRLLTTLYPPESQSRIVELFAKWRDGEQLTDEETLVVTKTGERRSVLLSAFAVWNSSGSIAHSVAVQKDITEQKELQERYRQTQKLEAIGQLAGGVAHDFNNLLMVILAHCDVVSKDLLPADPLAKEVTGIKACGERAAALTRQLLAFSRQQPLQPRVVDLNDLVSNLEKMLRRVIGEDLELVTALADDLGRTKIDPGQAEQVIINLAVNARDAMPEGGKLTIETANVELDEAYAETHAGVSTGPWLMLAMTDTGCGMDEATRNKVFEPFFTTKEQGKGTGLGLSTVYGIVKQSGGNIWVYSEPGVGTAFKIYLPRTEEELARESEPKAAEKPAGAGEHILLVEDEPAVREAVQKILTMSGYEVTAAANGGEALLAVEERDMVPDLLITDVVMPGMSGPELVERLRQSLPELKVLYMSGYTDKAIVHHGILEQDVHFLQKPFSAKDLGRKTREALDTEPRSGA